MNDLDNIGGKKNALIVLCGAPGSGKSTWGKDFAKKNNMVYVSTDEIRAEIGSGESDQSVSPQAFMIAEKRIRESLSMGKNAMIDATNCHGSDRRRFVKIARELNAYKIAVTFEVSRDELIKRNQQRERNVPLEVIDFFLDKYSRPSTVNFDKVIVK